MVGKQYIGWDIGGAHLKVIAMDRQGHIHFVKQQSTPIWQGLEHLSTAITDIRNALADHTTIHAITITAELTDHFKDRQIGIKKILQCLNNQLAGETYQIYSHRHGLIPAAQAAQHITEIASANWHATASFVAQQKETGILIDIGSTTTDIIPFAQKRLNNIAYNDHHRLRQHELLYTGVIRTAVMAILNKIHFNGQWQNIIAEKFSTMSDIYHLTGELNPDHAPITTADGAGKSKRDSARRLARMIGLDINETDTIQPIIDIAEYITRVQFTHINTALTAVLSRLESQQTKQLIGAGWGSFIAQKLAAQNNMQYTDFTELLNIPKADATALRNCEAAISVAQIAKNQ